MNLTDSDVQDRFLDCAKLWYIERVERLSAAVAQSHNLALGRGTRDPVGWTAADPTEATRGDCPLADDFRYAQDMSAAWESVSGDVEDVFAVCEKRRVLE